MDINFPWNSQASLLSKKGRNIVNMGSIVKTLRRSNSLSRCRKLNTIFFSSFSGPPGHPGKKNPGYPATKFVRFPWVSKGIPNILAPTPSRGRPPPHPKIPGPKSLGLGSFYFPNRPVVFLGRLGPLGSRCCILQITRWAFRPRKKKIFSPSPPPNSQQTPSRPLSPAPTHKEDPPSWVFP